MKFMYLKSNIYRLALLLILCCCLTALPLGCDTAETSPTETDGASEEIDTGAETTPEEEAETTPEEEEAVPETEPEEILDELDQMEQEVFQQINEYRLEQGLPALAWNETIADFCRVHSLNMANGSVPFSHDGFNERVNGIGMTIRFTSAGENVAYNNFPDPVTTAVDGWIESPGHLANIVGTFTLTGVGIAESDDGRYYFTQIFINN